MKYVRFFPFCMVRFILQVICECLKKFKKQCKCKLRLNGVSELPFWNLKGIGKNPFFKTHIIFNRDAAVNRAEGEKKAQILASEAQETEQINVARGEAEALRINAEARAQAIAMISDSLEHKV